MIGLIVLGAVFISLLIDLLPPTGGRPTYVYSWSLYGRRMDVYRYPDGTIKTVMKV